MHTVSPSAAQSVVQVSPAATRWLKLAVVYLLLGIGMGVAMGASGNFVLRPVHAHVGLLGWASLALAGLIYGIHPRAAASRLASAHFWLHNLGLPLMMGALAALLLGYPAAAPALVLAEVALAGGFLAFAWNVFFNLDS